MDARGIITYVSKRVVPLTPNIQLAGYGYVPTSQGQNYDGWEKTEATIKEELVSLEALAGSKPTIYAIHAPPAATALDMGFKHAHYGSSGVKKWLLEGNARRAVLSGHIHEATFVNGGIWRENVHGTPCFQPGGWHGEGLCAVLFDLEDPAAAEWIHDAFAVRSA